MRRLKTKRKSQGLALTTVAIYIIAFFSLATITLFINKPLKEGATNFYCSIQSQFGSKPAFCDSNACQGEKVTLDAENKNKLAMEIAAYSIACIKSKSGCSRGENIVCYTLNPKKTTEAVSEKDVARALEQGDGCPVLQNNQIVSPDGSITNYSSCGQKDQLQWRVNNNVIKGQSVIVEYNYQNHTIIIE